MEASGNLPEPDTSRVAKREFPFPSEGQEKSVEKGSEGVRYPGRGDDLRKHREGNGAEAILGTASTINHVFRRVGAGRAASGAAFQASEIFKERIDFLSAMAMLPHFPLLPQTASFSPKELP